MSTAATGPSQKLKGKVHGGGGSWKKGQLPVDQCDSTNLTNLTSKSE